MNDFRNYLTLFAGDNIAVTDGVDNNNSNEEGGPILGSVSKDFADSGAEANNNNNNNNSNVRTLKNQLQAALEERAKYRY